MCVVNQLLILNIDKIDLLIGFYKKLLILQIQYWKGCL